MKNNKKLVVDKYTQPIFIPNDLYVVKNYTKEDIQKLFIWQDDVEVEEREIMDGQGVTCAFMYRKGDKNKNLCVVLLLNTLECNLSNPEDAINIIGHEAHHATYDILDYCSIKLTDDTTEVYSFLNGWITQCAYKTYMK